jgi:hypothetical protein
MVSFCCLAADMSRSRVPDVSPRPPDYGSLLRVLAHSWRSLFASFIDRMSNGIQTSSMRWSGASARITAAGFVTALRRVCVRHLDDVGTDDEAGMRRQAPAPMLGTLGRPPSGYGFAVEIASCSF